MVVKFQGAAPLHLANLPHKVHDFTLIVRDFTLTIEFFTFQVQNYNRIVGDYTSQINNPLNVVDPDGEDWIITQQEKDGKTYYNITLNGVVYNNSSNKNFDLEKLKNSITFQIKSTFGVETDDLSVTVNVNLRVAKSADIMCSRSQISQKLGKTNGANLPTI